jgi:hypothetical protein
MTRACTLEKDVGNVVAGLAGAGHVPRDVCRNLHGNGVESIVAVVVVGRFWLPLIIFVGAIYLAYVSARS